MVRSVFHLTLRATEGFLRSLFHLLEWDLPVPDYTTLCARKRLGVSGKLARIWPGQRLKLWKVRQHGYTEKLVAGE